MASRASSGTGFCASAKTLSSGMFLAPALGGGGIAEQQVEVASDGVQRVRPGVAGVRREALQDAHRRDGTCRVIAVLERAGDARRVAEIGLLIEETRHLEVGVDARLQAAEELQEQALPVLNGRIRLLDAEDVRLQLLRAAQLPERARRRTARRSRAGPSAGACGRWCRGARSRTTPPVPAHTGSRRRAGARRPADCGPGPVRGGRSRSPSGRR